MSKLYSGQTVPINNRKLTKHTHHISSMCLASWRNKKEEGLSTHKQRVRSNSSFPASSLFWRLLSQMRPFLINAYALPSSWLPTAHRSTGLIYWDELRELEGARKSCWFCAAAGKSLEKSCPHSPRGGTAPGSTPGVSSGSRLPLRPRLLLALALGSARKWSLWFIPSLSPRNRHSAKCEDCLW